MVPAPESGAEVEVLEVERASATPTPPGAPPSRRGGALPPPARLGLEATQAWFLDAIRHPRSVRAGVQRAAARTGASPEAVLTRGPTLDTLARLDVYHNAYRVRLVEALADDFPTVRHALGHDAFERLAARVIHARPSLTRNLNTYGRVLVDWLGDPRRRVPHRSFLYDLARLEWAMVEVVHAPTPARLDPAALRAIPPERWPSLRFQPGAAVRLLELKWPANRYLQMCRTGQSPALPGRGWSATAVYRQGFTVWRMDLSPVTHGLLGRLFAGQPLGEALAPLEGRSHPERVMDWFSAWVSGGLFAGVTAAR